MNKVSTAVIGDIHGNLSSLDNLLSKIIPFLSSHTDVVFLGDYIDEGEDIKGTVSRLIKFKKEHEGKTVFLKGNHEQWLFESIRNPVKHSWLISMGGLSTIRSYSAELELEFRDIMQKTGPPLITDHLPLPYERLLEHIPEDHQQFFNTLENYYENEECICSHAGVSKEFESLETQTERNLFWGNNDFENYYKGEKLFVYGHFSRKAQLINDKITMLEKGNTICIDASKFDKISAVLLPEKEIIISE